MILRLALNGAVHLAGGIVFGALAVLAARGVMRHLPAVAAPLSARTAAPGPAAPAGNGSGSDIAGATP